MTEHRRGPARSESARRAILEATARQFTEKGYDHLTMEGIAAAARVGKQTIYRWWPSKGALIADCLIEGLLLTEDVLPENTGDIRADLSRWLQRLYQVVERRGERELMRSLIAAAAENDDVGRRLYESLGIGVELIGRLQQGVADGQLPANAPLVEISEALIGSLVLRVLSRKPTDDNDLERVIDVVVPRALGGSVTPQPGI